MGKGEGHTVTCTPTRRLLPHPGLRSSSVGLQINRDGLVDLLLGAGEGNVTVALLGASGGFVAQADSKLGVALAIAQGTASVSGMLATTLGAGCASGVSVITATPSGLWISLLTPSGDAVVNSSTFGVGVSSAAAGFVTRDGALDVLTCSTNATTLWLAPNVCQLGATQVAVNITLPGPCSGLGLGDVNRYDRLPATRVKRPAPTSLCRLRLVIETDYTSFPPPPFHLLWTLRPKTRAVHT